MKRLLSVLCVLAFAVVSLTGCETHVFKGVDELYALPKASEEYTSLQNALQALLDSGLEYSAPLSGSNTQPVQLQDLDGDGENEALAFFRESSAQENSLKIYIFKKNEEDVYTQACVIAGDGNSINSVLCCQLDTDEINSELVVTWQVSSAVYTLSAYSLAGYKPQELMTPTPYTRYSAVDMDSDGETELILMTVSSADDVASQAVYYDDNKGYLEVTSSANLSTRMASIDKTSTGTLADGTPVLYVTGSVQDMNLNASYQVTDIFALREGGLYNVTLNQDTQSSDSTIRYNLTGGQDINNDGVMEIPIPFTLTSHDAGSSDAFYAIDWQQYDLYGDYTVVSTTYYNSADGWYLELPEEWMDRLTLARKDNTLGSINERGIYFYYSIPGQEQDEPFIAIYKNTGANREKNGTQGDRMVLARDSDAVYSLELFSSGYELVQSAGSLMDNFHLITADWSTD